MLAPVVEALLVDVVMVMVMVAAAAWTTEAIPTYKFQMMAKIMVGASRCGLH